VGKQEKVPRSVLRSWIHAGQRAWLQPGGSWNADALFRMDKAGPRPSRDAREQGLKGKAGTEENT